MRLSSFASAAFVLLLALGPAAQASELDDLLSGYLDESGLTGISLAIARGNRIETATAGDLDVDGAAPVTPDTRFYVASCGKSAVAAAVLAAVATGKLALDAPVLPLVSDLAGISRLANIDTVTLRQLLNHSSGLVDYLDDYFAELSLEAGASGVSVEAALAEALDQPAVFAPGTGFDYSNTNYLLLGHILERVSGSMAAALEDTVLVPAGMDRTSVGIGPDTANAARGHDADGNDFSQAAWASTFGDGPLVSTPADLVRFAFALFRDGRLLPDDLLSEMTTGSAADPTYGLGMGADEDDWGRWYGHTGGIDGYEADYRYYPGTGVAMAYAANGTSDSEDALLDLVAEWVFAGNDAVLPARD